MGAVGKNTRNLTSRVNHLNLHWMRANSRGALRPPRRRPPAHLAWNRKCPLPIPTYIGCAVIPVGWLRALPLNAGHPATLHGSGGAQPPTYIGYAFIPSGWLRVHPRSPCLGSKVPHLCVIAGTYCPVGVRVPRALTRGGGDGHVWKSARPFLPKVRGHLPNKCAGARNSIPSPFSLQNLGFWGRQASPRGVRANVILIGKYCLWL